AGGAEVAERTVSIAARNSAAEAVVARLPSQKLGRARWATSETFTSQRPASSPGLLGIPRREQATETRHAGLQTGKADWRPVRGGSTRNHRDVVLGLDWHDQLECPQPTTRDHQPVRGAGLVQNILHECHDVFARLQTRRSEADQSKAAQGLYVDAAGDEEL